MVKICILQTDNRLNLDYLLLSQKVNKNCCEYFNYSYEFIENKNNEYIQMHPATKKIFIVNKFLIYSDYDVIVFLDSDAWVQDGYLLNEMIINLVNNSNKHGCFSRDPYINYNTYINSGSFIIKNNEFIKNMYNTIINQLANNKTYYNKWPYDQFYISNYIFKNKDLFNIFIPDILNTPLGKVIRHNWCKSSKMYKDLNSLINSNKQDIYKFSLINWIDWFDNKDFPNTDTNGYNYFA